MKCAISGSLLIWYMTKVETQGIIERMLWVRIKFGDFILNFIEDALGKFLKALMFY